MKNINTIKLLHADLKTHPLYQSLNSVEALRVFMKWHSFAVWDFMSLIKALQIEITCVELPWKPSSYPKDLVRFINEIVLGEESDENGKGQYTDHFSMYLEGMREIKSSTEPIEELLKDFDLSKLPRPIAKFVSFHIGLATSGELHKIASSFFYGRENLIPDIFEPVVKLIKNSKTMAPDLLYFLERHIELDGEEHGDLSEKCLTIICGGCPIKESEALDTAITSLKLRSEMWNFIHQEIKSLSQIEPVTVEV